MKREKLSIRTLNMKDFDNEIELIRDIYNKAWENNWGFVPMTDKEFNYLAKNLKPIANPHYIYLLKTVTAAPSRSPCHFQTSTRRYAM